MDEQKKGTGGWGGGQPLDSTTTPTDHELTWKRLQGLPQPPLPGSAGLFVAVMLRLGVGGTGGLGGCGLGHPMHSPYADIGKG